jgi:hypothetical protein
MRASPDVGIHEEQTPDGAKRLDQTVQRRRVPRRELQVVRAEGLELAGAQSDDLPVHGSERAIPRAATAVTLAGTSDIGIRPDRGRGASR